MASKTSKCFISHFKKGIHVNNIGEEEKMKKKMFPNAWFYSQRVQAV